MASPWALPDFDDHELVHFVTDRASGLRAIVAVHSTHLGPGAGGVRFWHYADGDAAVTDALRLSRGMSYKNAMAGLPLGGGKAVILANDARTKTPEMLSAYGRAIETLGGRYLTAEDVGMTVPDMVAIARETRHVSGLPAAAGAIGGDPGPHTSYGIFLGIEAAVSRALGRNGVAGLHIAIQGAGSVGGGVARLAAAQGARITVADIDLDRAAALAHAVGGTATSADEILSMNADVISPCALGAILTEDSIAALRAPIVAGGANNQLAAPGCGARLHARGILYAPDYVINAGGIINVASEHLGDTDPAIVDARIAGIPTRLERIWAESASGGQDPATVADRMAQALIGRG